MISSIGQSDNVQRFAAVNALRTSAAQLKPKAEEIEENTQEATTNIAPKGLLDRINVDEVREYATYVGEFDISDEDIKYGMIYGRSVIAEFLA